jgi:hypothetical protein
MQQFPVLGASILAALLVSTAARAQVTPEQVWQNWKDLSDGYGQTLTTAAETREGDTLSVTGVVIVSEAEDVSSRATIDRIDFRDRGDGTVEVTLSPQIPLTATGTAEDGESMTLNATIDQADLVIIAASSDAETRYDVTAPSLKVTVTAPPSAADPADVSVVLDLTALAGTYAVATAELSQVTSDLTAESLRLAVNATSPGETAAETVAFTTTLRGLAGTSSAVLLSAEQMEDMAAALAAGFSTDGSLTYQASDYATDVTEVSGVMTSTGTSGPGSFSFGLNKDRMAFGATGADAVIRVSGSTIPFPELLVSYAEFAFDFLMPVSKSDTPQDFKALTRIVDLAVSDEIWAMFDPTASLPRDPATLVIDLDGKARWLVDMFSPEAAGMETVPGELHALTVNELMLRAVGASVAGKGAFTFDNTDLTTFDGMPAPTGVLDLTIVGATALLDRLSQSGLLPPDQVMGAKMMIGLFARPGEGEDTLTTQVEFKDKGLFVNGQQLQ